MLFSFVVRAWRKKPQSLLTQPVKPNQIYKS